MHSSRALCQQGPLECSPEDASWVWESRDPDSLLALLELDRQHRAAVERQNPQTAHTHSAKFWQQALARLFGCHKKAQPHTACRGGIADFRPSV